MSEDTTSPSIETIVEPLQDCVPAPPQRTAASPDLQAVVQPLIDCLNHHYRTSDNYEYEIPLLGQFGVLEFEPSNVLSIELPDDLPNHDPAMKAIVTLLAASGSEAKWGGPGIPTLSLRHEPLRFSLVKRVANAGHYWAGARYLVIDHTDHELDLDAAAGQVASLVARLAETSALIELGPEERALL